MIFYLHGFDATSPGNHEKMRQLQFIDPDVRLISYSTLHPKHDMQHLLKQVAKQMQYCDDPAPLMVGVGLGAYWAERIGFLNGLKSVLINPNLHPEETMQGKIDRPEEYADIANKCVSEFRLKNTHKAMCILSRVDEVLDSESSAEALKPYYTIEWDETQAHKFPQLAVHLPKIKAFKLG
ncbi:alpha/beta hydrolase YcfP [Shewanella seohaensis]|uniref:alpha/beta hydrolase YcfP n=1 Tax=Shewanella seohaensis TaxID=755175 RepID=UPI00200DDA0B|nr:alpha/beta hydrolase YcfP [Shewanella seohaensis]MCL1121773.1 alpha/beta hydrolase YcfP [Shewanella seohaensis]UXM80603.1 alpha/beta hydrolase YcfP [Shewanella seohaensis]